MHPEAETYIAAISTEHWPLFDRLHRLVLEVHPTAEVTWAYKMPTFAVGKHQLHAAVWKHGLSLYGWRADADGGIVEGHPHLANDKGTLRIRPQDAEEISDDELRGLVRGALGG